MMIYLFAYLLMADGAGLGFTLTSLLYCETSVTTKKSIVKLYKYHCLVFLLFLR